MATSLNNLGTESINLGDYAAARDYHLRALAILRQTLGETHPHVANSLNNLGAVSAELGDYAAAHDYYLQALTINQDGETVQSFTPRLVVPRRPV